MIKRDEGEWKSVSLQVFYHGIALTCVYMYMCQFIYVWWIAGGIFNSLYS